MKESDLINGSTISQFIRQQQYSGYINTYYDDGITIKSIRKYSNGKKNGFQWYVKPIPFFKADLAPWSAARSNILDISSVEAK